MQVVERQNIVVRSLVLDMDKEARDRLFKLEIEFIERDVYTHSRMSGPKIVDGRAVEGWYTRIFEIEEAYADEFLSRLKGVNKDAPQPPSQTET